MVKKKKVVKKIMNENKISNKPVYKFLGFILFLVLLFFVSSYLIKMTYNFDYQGISFTKEKFGELKVYHHYYYFKDGYGELFQYNLYLRNDPRENNVSVDGKIVYPSQKDFIYISIGDRVEECPDSSLAIAQLSSFITDNQMFLKTGLANENKAEESNVPHVSCDKYPDDFVISLMKGDETSITKKNKCYEIEIANCDILKAVEKFEVQSLVDRKN